MPTIRAVLDLGVRVGPLVLYAPFFCTAAVAFLTVHVAQVWLLQLAHSTRH